MTGEKIERLQVELTATNKLFNLALAAGNAAKDEIVRLQTRIKELETWKTPDYSEAQKAGFGAQGYWPPPQAIPWHFLPEVPEPRANDIDGVWIWAAYQIGGNEICGDAIYYPERDEWCTVPDSWEDGRDQKIVVRCWVYPPYAAPPKPQGEPPAIELAPEPQKDEVKNAK